MLKLKTRLILNSKLDELKMNLENNYKDLAHDALKSYLAVLEQLKSDKMINDKDYAKYKAIGEDYKSRMADYHH